MKYISLYLVSLILLFSCNSHHNHSHNGKEIEVSEFTSEKISQTASIVLKGKVDEVFPLFNPIEEQKWAPVFKPHFIYPSDNLVQEGMSFKTAGHGDEPEYLWIITKYNLESHLVQYLVSTANRYWTISVECKEYEGDSKQTSAKITYSYFALTEKGVELNIKHLDKIYSNSLIDWEEAINSYLKG